MAIALGEVGHIIQLAIAPVFLLTGVGTNLLVLTNRLARIIDRSRMLEEKLEMGVESKQNALWTPSWIYFSDARARSILPSPCRRPVPC